jgi:hypothetical protein
MAVLAVAGGAVSLAAQAAEDPSVLTLRDAAFAQPSDLSPTIRRQHGDAFTAAGPTAWRSTTTPLAVGKDGRVVESLQMSVGGALDTPVPTAAALRNAEIRPQDYEVTYQRGWPGAVSGQAGGYDIEVSPHAGLGVSNMGGSAEAGATVTFGQSADKRVADTLDGLGVRDGESFGDQGRWYLFAAASGRAVGLNMMRGEGGWDRAGWSTDPASALIADAQAGVGWRKGPMQASFGYQHREVKGRYMIFGQEAKDDDVVALSLSIKPRR